MSHHFFFQFVLTCFSVIQVVLTFIVEVCQLIDSHYNNNLAFCPKSTGHNYLILIKHFVFYRSAAFKEFQGTLKKKALETDSEY